VVLIPTSPRFLLQLAVRRNDTMVSMGGASAPCVGQAGDDRSRIT
jgi:hypothetical protein